MYPTRRDILRTLSASWCAASMKAIRLAAQQPSLVMPTRLEPEYQFGAELNDLAGDPLFAGRTVAFLWVPPGVARLRAVLLAPANIIERRVTDDATLREQAAKDGLALVFFQASWARGAMLSPALPEYLQAMLNALGERSGYEELGSIPWITIGHSGNTIYCQQIAKLCPQRLLANLIVKGALPVVPKDGSASGAEVVPTLFFTGEFEEVMPPGKVRNAWWTGSMNRFRALRTAAPKAPLSGMQDKGHGHIDWLPAMQGYLNLFLRKAMAARLPAGTEELQPVSFASGWLGDPTGGFESAPVTEYKGDPVQAFWFFDREQAMAWGKLFHVDDGKREQLLAFEQHGEIAPWWKDWAVQDLQFEPEKDGITFRVRARFREQVAAPYADAGTSVGHVAVPGIQYRSPGWAGNIEQVGPDTFRIAFDREGFNGRTAHVLIGALQPGDREFRETTAVAGFFVPIQNTEGSSQTIHFPAIPEQKGRLKPIRLKATATSGLPVRYFVSWGPARIVDEMLIFTPIPDRARYPVEVRVTAYQWGRGIEPRVKTAPPVTQTFLIHSRT